MTDPLEVADLIDAGHDVLLDKGWHQGSLRDFVGGTGKVCAIGAICDAAHGRWELEDAALGALGQTIGQRIVHYWNDDPSRTEDEVFDAFRQTSKRLREEAGK